MSEDHTAEREAFEAWYSAEDQETDDPERAYELTEEGMNELTKYCVWQGWQARAAAPAQSDTHPTTGEEMGTDAQEATAWRLKAENLQRENAALRDALEGARNWFEAQDKVISKGGGSPFERWSLQEQRDVADEALAGKAPASKEKEYAELPDFEDVRVQTVYEILAEMPDGKPDSEHWEGWCARHIIAALGATHALRTGGKSC